MLKNPGINPLCYVLERQYRRNYVIKSKLFSRRLAVAKNLYKKDLYAHYGCVNAIEFSKEGELLISGGDDRRVLLWLLPKILHGNGSPISMHTNHLSNIFCLDFSSDNSRIFSGGNDDQVIVHDVNTQYLVVRLPHKNPVFGLNVNPQNDNILATAGDDGRILLYDLRETYPSSSLTASNHEAVQCLAKQKTGFHSVMFSPSDPRWLTTANSEEGIGLWDCRKPKEQLIHFDSDAGPISGISACFNASGSHILALRRRLPPVLYATQHENAVCQFYHPQYYNSCTMKTCCFAGENDEYILSGSDDFNLYMWNMPKNDSEWGTTHLVLSGHRSIVNQVRYNKQNNLIASSGVEKMVKLWSTLPIGTWKGSLLREQSEPVRPVYTHEEYIYFVGSDGERISHDYSDHSTQEDSRMMAFFDSLIQREIEGWNSSNNSDSDSDTNVTLQKFNEMFDNSRSWNAENKRHKPNRIAQLIAKKRHSLAKMAHAKSLTSIRRKASKREKKSKKHNGSLHKSKQKSKSPKNERKKQHNNSKKEEHKRKYRTRQSLREISNNSDNLEMPSTSTGITNSTPYRVVELDSEEESISAATVVLNGNNGVGGAIAEANLINILPTPINGTHDMFINVLETTTAPSRENGHTNEIDNDVVNNSDSESDYEFNYVTPIKKRRTNNNVRSLDSGLGSSRNPELSSDDDLNNYNEKYRKIKRAKVNNVRKQIAADSDSN